MLHTVGVANSLVSEYDHYPSVRHLVTHQDSISLGQKIVHVHHSEKHLMEPRLFIIFTHTTNETHVVHVAVLYQNVKSFVNHILGPEISEVLLQYGFLNLAIFHGSFFDQFLTEHQIRKLC